MVAVAVSSPAPRRVNAGSVVTVTREYQYGEITPDLLGMPGTYGCEGCARDVVSGGAVYAYPRGGLHAVLWCLPCWQASGRQVPKRPQQAPPEPCVRCGEPDAPVRTAKGTPLCPDCWERTGGKA